MWLARSCVEKRASPYSNVLFLAASLDRPALEYVRTIHGYLDLVTFPGQPGCGFTLRPRGNPARAYRNGITIDLNGAKNIGVHHAA